MMKKTAKILGVIIGIFAVMLVAMFIMMGNDMKNLKYHEVNLNELENGVYRGEAKTSLVKVEVEVEVSNNNITKIVLLKHENGLGSKAESIIKKMISMNTYEVDAVSGATASSEVIKSAVSDALRNRKE